jgi:hypothetical protein
MMGTQFKTPAGNLVAAADLSIGAEVLDYDGNAIPVTWCRKLPKKKRLLVDLHTNPFTVTGSHRIVVPGGEIIAAKALKRNDEVLIGGGCQRLLKATTRYGNLSVMELEFANDATVEVHAPSILTKGSDPSKPIDEDGAIKCKEEMEDQVMAGDSDQPCDGSTDLPSDSVRAWPDTDDEFS